MKKQLISNEKFNIENWRLILKEVGKRMPISNCQTLVPFGFEVTNDKSFLKKNLNRFYCYFGNDSEKESNLRLEEIFKDILLEEIERNDKVFFQKISIIVFQEDKRKTLLLQEVSENNLMINIEQRIINCSLIEDYSRYIACCLFEIEKKILPEFLRFDKNNNVRNRFYQLYLILEYSTQYLKLPFTTEEQNMFNSVHKLNKNPITHYHTGETDLPPTSEDKEKLKLILSRIHKLYELILLDANYREITIKAYNNNHVLRHDVPNDYYQNVVNYISKTYLDYAKDNE